MDNNLKTQQPVDLEELNDDMESIDIHDALRGVWKRVSLKSLTFGKWDGDHYQHSDNAWTDWGADFTNHVDY